MTRRGNVVAIAVGVAVLVSACASDVAAPNTTASEVEVATTPPPTSTEAPATPTTPTTPSTDAPTTTLDPAATLAADVEADLLEAFRLGREASMDPFNADKEAAAMDRRLGVIAENFAANLADYRARNYAIRENPTVPASVTVEVPASLVLDGADVAELQICEVDSWIVVEVGAGPNGTDAVVNPDVTSYRSMVFLRRVDGLWRFEGGTEIGRWEGGGGCPAGL